MPQSLSRVTPAPTGAAGTPVLSGTIAGVTPQNLNIQGGPGCGYVNVAYNGSTPISANGLALAPGVFANVYGSGSCSSSFTATAISLASSGTAGSGSGSGGSSASSAPASIAQTHALTADYLGGFAGTQSVSAASAAPVLSWAEVSIQDANTISGSGIKTLEYIDPLEQSSTDPLYSSDDSTFAHDCSGNRIPVPYVSGQWLMNPASSDLLSKLNGWQSAEEGRGHIDAFFYDNIDDLYGLTTLPCGITQSSWDSANAALVGGSNEPVVYNGYSLNADAAALITSSTVKGAVMEDCYARKGQPTAPYTTGGLWTQNENLELAGAAAGKLVFCYNTPTTDASSAISLRSYVYASFLLGYSPSSSVLWEYFSTPSGLHVFPESKIVPMNPLVASPSSVSSLQSGGVYVREYSACYLDGSNVGPCAAVVNSSSSSSYPMPSLRQSYGHTMALSGYGVLDGGSVSVSGSAPPSTLPAETGFVLFK